MISISAGEFRHKIKILRPTIERDEDNIPVEKLTEIFTTKAKITNVRGNELRIGEGTIYKQEKRVHLRVVRSKPIKQNDVVLFNDQKYNITYVNNIEEMNRYYELKMELME
ncbi:phage head closure protein [Clostridium sp. UBA1056]|uniref:phage head closure protein n=1 Tax=unclassified Clostridium TaxID=2614128 RepID=UPI0032178C0A